MLENGAKENLYFSCMKRLIKQSTLDKALNKHRNKKQTIGFTPTLGALHSGHLELMQRSQRECDIGVCSIFVNPTQFNESSDLKKYPRTLNADKALLNSINMDYLFNPSVAEVYPEDLDTSVKIDFGQLDKVMEGAMRPGHFEGVAQVVKRLLDMVRPTHLYMGQKDFQQFTICQHMIDTLNLPVKLVVCPIVREKDGVAMSSRNTRLTPDHRKRAVIINKMLNFANENLDKMSVSELEKTCIERLSIPGFKPEYFTISDGRTLQPIKDVSKNDYIVACTAVWAGEVRLIDNMILRK